MSTRRILLATSNGYPFPLRLSMYYHSNLGGYLYTPEGQPEIEEYKRGTIFNFIKYFNKNVVHGEETGLLQYGDFTLYIWNENVEVYIHKAYLDDDNICIIGYDESNNEYTGTIYVDYGETTLNGTVYSYSPGEIYMYRSN